MVLRTFLGGITLYLTFFNDQTHVMKEAKIGLVVGDNNICIAIYSGVNSAYVFL